MILSPTTSSGPGSRWSAAAPDMLALLYSLVLAWFLNWEVKDLVWSLWLSSLTVGYINILLTIFGPLVQRAGNDSQPMSAIAMGGGLFMLAFFTVHFGMFHFIHSAFLNLFFPVLGSGRTDLPSVGLYLVVLKSYWPFVLGAAVSERTNLAMAVKKTNPMGPYQNVIRMHLLIFFFAGAAAARLNSFIIYAVVLCVYFLPFRALFGRQQPGSPSAES